MNCPLESRNSELLIALAAGELDDSATAAVERHIAACQACAAFAAQQRAVWDMMDAWEAPPISPDFDQRLYRRIRQDEPATFWDRLLRWLAPVPLRHAVPLGATACLLLAAGLMLQNPRTPVLHQPSATATVRVDQVETALDDLELLNQFNAAQPADSSHSDAM